MASRSLSVLHVEIYIGARSRPYILINLEELSAPIHRLLHRIILLQFVVDSVRFKDYPSPSNPMWTFNCLSDPLLQTILVGNELLHWQI